MQGLLSWIGTAFGALFVVAVVVAWWEHLVRSKQVRAAHETPPPRAVTVDVRLDTLTAESPGDSAERRATLDGAMGRMAQAGTPGSRAAWLDTRPMVQAGQRGDKREDKRAGSRSDTPSDTAASPLA